MACFIDLCAMGTPRGAEARGEVCLYLHSILDWLFRYLITLRHDIIFIVLEKC
jgi:hypothetical protein